MTFGSVCSGIGGAECAWLPLGWEACWSAEIDPFASAVFAARFPATPNLGDFTKIGREVVADAVDVLVGGCPCQSFSVAGLRQGLDDSRGNLTLEFLALARRLLPRWVVYENVPGLLSDNGGRTFGTVLGLLAECGYGFAYRLCDAQYFGLAQRRARVFLVGYLGDWRPPAAILLERESLRGDFAARGEARADLARPLAACACGDSGYRNDPDTADTLIVGTLGAFQGGTDDNEAQGERLVALADPIKCREWDTSNYEGRVHNVVPFDPTQLSHPENRSNPQPGDPAPTLPKDGHGIAIAFTERRRPDGRSLEWNEEQAYALDNPGAGGRARSRQLHDGVLVRRLTPRECERLMGFPDDWTLIRWRGKPAADSPRYRALGNAFCPPVLRWIGDRMGIVDAALRAAAS